MTTDSKVSVLAYGSLMDEKDLQRTCPSGRRLRPVELKGWRRCLHLWAHNRECFVANAFPDEGVSMNAWLVEVPQSEMDALDRRERQYTREQVRCHDEQGVEHEAWIYRNESSGGSPDWSHADQQHYLQLCLGGCHGAPAHFKGAFLKSTWVQGKSLADLEAFPPS